MTVPGLNEIAGELKRLKIRYVVVGGGAVAQQHSIATEDLDIIVATGDYDVALSALQASPLVTWAEQSPTMATVRFRLTGGIFELDVIDAALFAGRLDQDEFIRFLKAEASTTVGGIRFASIPAVWYMRLTNPQWEPYVDKVARDIEFGVPRSYLDDTLRIGVRFGRDREIRARIRLVEQLLT